LLQARHLGDQRQVGFKIGLVECGRVGGLLVEGDQLGHKAPKEIEISDYSGLNISNGSLQSLQVQIMRQGVVPKLLRSVVCWLPQRGQGTGSISTWSRSPWWRGGGARPAAFSFWRASALIHSELHGGSWHTSTSASARPSA